jgi:hypothetical protein
LSRTAPPFWLRAWFQAYDKKKIHNFERLVGMANGNRST